MKDGEAFAEYVRILSGNENTLQVGNDALTALWSTYHIASAHLMLEVKHTPYTPEGCIRSSVFTVPGQITDENVKYEKQYVTGEGGAVKISLCGGRDCGAWSDEERGDLEVIADILFFHCGRFRLIKMMEENRITDGMTGLYNADGYMQMVNRVNREGNLKQYNAFYFNLRRYNLVNKKYGKEEGDEILCRYAKVLRDFADADEVVGRLGGDNFVALIKKERTQSFLDFLAETKVKGVLGERQTTVTISAIAGVYEIDDSMEYFEQVLSRSGAAMNVAKNVAKKPVVFMTEELNQRIHRQKQIVARFSKALERGEFEVYYQPKVETNGYNLIGAEALVRWFHDGEMISPIDFIPIIEQDGSICSLDFYMLEKVCQDIADWLQRGFEPVRVSVNFSRKHLANEEFAESIMAIVDKYHIDHRYIEVEVTETTDEEEQGKLSLFMEKMQESKIAVAIDDFGTGYSSLNILRTFPVDVLKIDKSFIDNGNDTENDQIVLSNIVRMAKELNMDVVTEGVENWEQVEFLNDMGCNTVQGFLFDKPMKREDFEKRIQNPQYDITRVVDYME